MSDAAAVLDDVEPSKKRFAGRIVSVGYERRSLEDLISTLRLHRVEVLVDVRQTPVSRRAGFSKTKLAAALDSAGIEYRHAPSLGNPKENREPFREGRGDARRVFDQLLVNEGRTAFEALIELAAQSVVAMLCFEREHDSCHRSCISDRAQREYPRLSVDRA